ncbi:trehalase isoform X2 [Rhincodon typus]|uniref:trehalase isoform X2 n=1 Tax=Rhincodon typus TaxID=259920 RepID=UPI00202ECCF7|nr:trehalase isoform X2 [Rhincodon typus]
MNILTRTMAQGVPSSGRVPCSPRQSVGANPPPPPRSWRTDSGGRQGERLHFIMALKSWNWLVVALCLCDHGSAARFPFPCDSHIYCTGELLHKVQMAKLFDDDKHFVDMKLKVNPDVILEAFRNLTSPTAELTKEQLKLFVKTYFDAPGQEFEKWTPADWGDHPQILQKIPDQKLRLWATELHALWKVLGRKITQNVQSHPELYSQIYVPKPLIVPGGRFREYYYWDSYWIIKGLLLSEMSETSKGMIENFLYLMQRFELIPNGGRIYYERRSQPPFLVLMMESYINVTNDLDFLKQSIDLLDKEYEFWMKNRVMPVSIGSKTHHLNRYIVEAAGPRPESFSKDVELAQAVPEAAQGDLWMELKTGAESGWDFSSRWFIDSNGKNNGTLKDTKTKQVLPVDLNSILCKNERILAIFHKLLGNFSQAQYYEDALKRRIDAVRDVFWDETQGVWFDYNLLTNHSNTAFYASNLAPLWAECFAEQEAGKTAEMVIRYLEGQQLLSYKNGIPTSLVTSGEQWDYPNAWPPLQQMIIEGLAKSNSEAGQRIAFQQAQKWIHSNWHLYEKRQAMFEKYDVSGDGKPGGGGEYDVQVGFGWTNGVALQLLDQYGDQLTSGVTGLTCFTLLAVLPANFLLSQF